MTPGLSTPEPPPTARAPQTAARRRAPGEAKVWLVSVGLSIGLLMVVALLFIIVQHGVAVFWPRRVVQLEFKPGASFEFQGRKQVTGEVVKRQEKMAVDPKVRAAALARGERLTELQLYVGNKDAWGQNFVFVDEAMIATRSTPPNLMVVERMEYGDAIGTPVALKARDGAVINANEAAFAPRLHSVVKEVNDRRKRIEKIEKNRIGAINARMEGLKIQAKADASHRAKTETEIARLQADYEVLAREAGELRARQDEWLLELALPGGTARSIPAGQIVTYYFPNQLGFLSRCGWFAHNLWSFLTDEPREANTEGGIFPAIFGTFVMTLLMSAAVVPFGVVAAIYLREYAHQGFAVRAVRIAVNNLAGVPSIVFGVFGLGFFVYFVGGTVDQLFYPGKLPTPTFGTGGILWAALTLALMTVPVVIVATEEALGAVPRGMREASLACGASKWQTVQHILLPSAVPGILTGLILSMARGAGEVAPLMLVGVVKLAPSLPLDLTPPFIHMERKFMHLGFHIYDLGFQSPDSEAAKPMVFATTFLLILLVVLLNLTAILLRERLRRKSRTSTF